MIDTGNLAGIQLTSSVYPPGDYILTITAIDVEEQAATVQVNLTIQGALGISYSSLHNINGYNSDMTMETIMNSFTSI